MATEFEISLAKNWGTIKGVVPDHIDEARLARIASEAIKRTPRLAECSVSSLLDAVIRCAQLGLEPNDGTGRAWIIPRYNKHAKPQPGMEASFQIGYRGMIDLARRSGQIDSIEAHAVFENDDFRPHFGTNPYIEHVPAMKDRGPIVGAYCVIWTKGSTRAQHEVLTAEDIEKIRDTADKGSFAWKDWPEEMVRNSVLKRGLKRAPADTELRAAIGIIDQAEGVPVESVMPGVFDHKPKATAEDSGERDPWSAPAGEEEVLLQQTKGGDFDLPE